MQIIQKLGLCEEKEAKVQLAMLESSVKNYFHGLIYRRHQGLGKPNKIYVHDILQPETFEWTPEIQLKKWRNKK